MKTVILCGGKGTRIRDVAADIPKPMVRIGEYPILRHIMEIYSRHGHQEFVLCLGYRGWDIKEYFLNYQAATRDIDIDFRSGPSVTYPTPSDMPEWRVILAETGVESATGWRVKQTQRYIGDETFMLTYGDGVGDVDISELISFHRRHGRLLTMTSVHPPSRFGEMVIEGDQVVRFEEKPQTAGGAINGGFMVCEPGVFDYIPDDAGVPFEQEPLMKLAADGQLMTYRHEGFWMPMDTYREYVLLNDLWRQDRAPWIGTTSGS